MSEVGIRHFLCDTIGKASVRGEWVKWLRSLELYLAAEEITDPIKKRNKLLHFGGPQLQEVAYNLPGAIATYNPETQNDVYLTLVEKLTEYFSPKQNSTFERHMFRSLRLDENESFNQFLLKIRQQANKCAFGNSAQEATEINIKDKIIDSWAPLDLKKKLLENEKTLDEIIGMCQVHEQIGSQSKVMDLNMAGSSTSISINKIQFHNQCSRCGKTGHPPSARECPARSVKCHKCNLQGHFAIACRSRTKRPYSTGSTRYSQHQFKRKRTGSQVNFVDEDQEGSGAPETPDGIRNFECFKISDRECSNDDDIITCDLGGVPITMLIDSGSKVNIINGHDWELLTKNSTALWHVNCQCSHNLKGYASGHSLDVSHQFNTTICLLGQNEIIGSFYVVNQGEISILGKDTAKRLGVLKLGSGVNQIEKKVPFPKIKDIQVKLTIDARVTPVRQPVRRVPISVESLVEKKLEEALKAGIIEKVREPSVWISPIVVIFKPNDDIRICVDMRRANEAILRENYPLPTFDVFMTKLRNAKYFSRLELVNAYHQLELAEESRHITTFITHRGMFRYKRLMFGVNSAPEIFQRVFEEMLSPCRNCLNYLDDIIIYGSTEQEHDVSKEFWKYFNKIMFF